MSDDGEGVNKRKQQKLIRELQNSAKFLCVVFRDRWCVFEDRWTPTAARDNDAPTLGKCAVESCQNPTLWLLDKFKCRMCNRKVHMSCAHLNNNHVPFCSGESYRNYNRLANASTIPRAAAATERVLTPSPQLPRPSPAATITVPSPLSTEMLLAISGNIQKFVCRSRPPVDVVAMLCKFIPPGTFALTNLTNTRDDQTTIVHIAATYHISVDVLLFFKENYPEEFNACLTIRNNKSGYTPLNCALSYGGSLGGGDASMDMIQLLIDANGDALLLEDKCGYIPLHSASFGKDDDIMLYLIHRTHEKLDVIMHEVPSCTYSSPLLVSTLVCAHHIRTANLIRLVQDLIESEGSTQLQWHDNEGNLPLHHAARAVVYDDTSDYKKKFIMHTRGDDYVRRRSLIDVILEAYPNAAKHCNKQKEYPLHVAIKYGKKVWYDKWGWKDDGIKLLWEAYPEAGRIKDCTTGLYPFELAAASCVDSDADVDSDAGGGDFDLSTVYELLRNQPHLLTERLQYG